MLERKFEIGKIKRMGILAVAPIYSANNFDGKIVMFDKALRSKRFEVIEPREKIVNGLKVYNALPYSVFIACGMTIEGDSQNRYSKHPCLIGPYSNTILPVNCAEQGQGLIRGSRYNASSTIVIPSVRGGYRRDGSERGIDRDQHNTWAQIDRTHTTTIMDGAAIRRRLAEMNNSEEHMTRARDIELTTQSIVNRINPKRNYIKVDEDAENDETVKQYREEIGKARDSQVGIVMALGVGDKTAFYTDIFGRRSMLRRVHPKLAKSFAILAASYTKEGELGNVELKDVKNINEDDISRFLENYRDLGQEKQEQEHAGVGKLYVADGDIKASALLYGKDLDQIVQITMKNN
ncbi:hypothetical protein KY343_00795 [Candidatus Woesearchaeota archaeon]|nr:hypothetical protein [Candidatus Woesearchaeota archaeon]